MNKVLTHNGNIIYKFDYPIKKYINIGDIFVVLLDVPAGKILNENVLCVAVDGGVRWIIEEIERMYEDSPYTNIEETDEGIRLCNWDGTKSIVDIQTGLFLSDSRSHHRPW
jgi:hypothetical protein